MKKVFGSVLLAALAAVSLLGGCAQKGFDKAKEIVPVTREEGSGTRSAFIELFGVEEKDADGNKADKTTKEAITANKTDIMLNDVVGEKYAIGYISLGSLNDQVKAVQIDGVTASVDNVKNGTYKIQRPFVIATKGEADGLKKDFIDFVMSAEGQQVIADNHYISQDGAAAFAGSKPAGTLKISGSSSVYPVMEKLVEAYKALNTGAAVTLQQSDSSTGLKDTLNDISDIGMSSRELKDGDEKDKLVGVEIALDGIAVIVNKENPADNLTKDQVKDIFVGKTTKWSDVPG